MLNPVAHVCPRADLAGQITIPSGSAFLAQLGHRPLDVGVGRRPGKAQRVSNLLVVHPQPWTSVTAVRCATERCAGGNQGWFESWRVNINRRVRVLLQAGSGLPAADPVQMADRILRRLDLRPGDTTTTRLRRSFRLTSWLGNHKVTYLMGYQATLEILADPTRRALVDRLRGGPLSVGTLAAGLPVSRPAVSKHLRLMKDAGLVSMSEEGTRNLYQLDLRALDEVRRYLDGFWDASLARFKNAAESSTTKGRNDE